MSTDFSASVVFYSLTALMSYSSNDKSSSFSVYMSTDISSASISPSSNDFSPFKACAFTLPARAVMISRLPENESVTIFIIYLFISVIFKQKCQSNSQVPASQMWGFYACRTLHFDCHFNHNFSCFQLFNYFSSFSYAHRTCLCILLNLCLTDLSWTTAVGNNKALKMRECSSVSL